jgi:hypothetical protein
MAVDAAVSHPIPTYGAQASGFMSKTQKLWMNLSTGSPGIYYGTSASVPSLPNYGDTRVIATAAVTDVPSGFWVGRSGVWNPVVNDLICQNDQGISTFTGVNQGSGALSTNGTVGTGIYNYVWTGVNDGATSTLRGMGKAYSSATMYVEAIVNMMPVLYSATQIYSCGGVFFREASTAKAVSVFWALNATAYTCYLQYSQWTNNTTRGTNVSAFISGTSKTVAFRVYLSGSTVYGAYSVDKINWVTISSVAKATAFTTGPDTIGFGGWGYNAVNKFTIRHFAYGAL